MHIDNPQIVTDMKKIIYTTEITEESLDAAKDFLHEQGLSTHEQAVWEQASEENGFWLQDEQANLDKSLEDNIILIADIGRWNGRKSGYKIIGNNVANILSSLSEGEVEFFVDTKDRQVKAVQSHHDGTNYITFRQIKPDVNINNLTSKIYNGIATANDISRYTTSLYPRVAAVYGW